jgi:ketosteroid isomerase-like protein
MNLTKTMVVMALFCSFAATEAPAQTSATPEITALLHEFLQAAGRGDREVFDKFFADDVIYTRAAGVVISKSDIMKRLGKPTPASQLKSTYSAEDIIVHEYGDTAIVAFRLGARTQEADGKVETAHFRNTGTFLKRNGRWQAVAWQATKISEAANAR